MLWFHPARPARSFPIGGGLSFLDMLDLDADYGELWGLGLDLKILARTVPALMAVDRAG